MMGALAREYEYADVQKSEMTVYEYRNFIRRLKDPRFRFELCDGYLVMMAGGASPIHHQICGYIARSIGNYLEGKKCKVFQDMNLYLYNDDIGKCKNAFQPDVMICCDRGKYTSHGFEGVPDFIVEVISQSTARHDYITKLEKYMQFGVKEYWIVDIFKDQILVYLSQENGPPLVKQRSFDNKIKISIFEDLKIDFPELFRMLYEDETFEDSLT
jgi:Uma2 family endonuclease